MKKLPFLMLGLIVIGLASCGKPFMAESQKGELTPLGLAGKDVHFWPLPKIIIEPIGHDWLVLKPIDDSAKILDDSRILSLEKRLDAVKGTYSWWWKEGGLENKPNPISPYRLTRRSAKCDYRRAMARTGTDYMVIDTISVDPIIGNPGGLGDNAKMRMVLLPYLYTHPQDSLQYQKGRKLRSQTHKFWTERIFTSLSARFIKFEDGQIKITAAQKTAREATNNFVPFLLILCLITPIFARSRGKGWPALAMILNILIVGLSWFYFFNGCFPQKGAGLKIASAAICTFLSMDAWYFLAEWFNSNKSVPEIWGYTTTEEDRYYSNISAYCLVITVCFMIMSNSIISFILPPIATVALGIIIAKLLIKNLDESSDEKRIRIREREIKRGQRYLKRFIRRNSRQVKIHFLFAKKRKKK